MQFINTQGNNSYRRVDNQTDIYAWLGKEKHDYWDSYENKYTYGVWV